MMDAPVVDDVAYVEPGPATLAWYQVLKPLEWAAVAILALCMGFWGYTAAPLGLGAVVGAVLAILILAGAWAFGCNLRLRSVLILREEKGVVQWCLEWWTKADVAQFDNAACFWTSGKRRMLVLDRLHSMAPVTPWITGGLDVEVASVDLARSLEQSGARKWLQSKSKATAEVIKIGFLAALAGGGALLINVLYNGMGTGG